MVPQRIVVVGAGLAGLTAARHLQTAHHDVVLLEASQRLGGRARTVRDGFVDGQYVESGAEWVDTHHHRMNDLLTRHGMSLQGLGQEWTTIRRWLYRADRLHSPSELTAIDSSLTTQLQHLEQLVSDAADLVVDPSRPHATHAAAQLDRQSIADLASGLDLGPIATLFHHRDSQGEFAAEADQVSLLFLAQQRAQGRITGGDDDVRAHRVEGGLDTLIARVAADLMPFISLGESLLAIETDNDSLVAVTDRRRIRADHIVLACALPALRTVDFRIEVDPVLAEAIGSLGYGTVTKTAVQFADRSWPSGYATTDTVSQRMYEPTIDQTSDVGVLMSYAGGDGGRQLAALSENARLALVEADMRTVHHVSSERVGGFSRAWSGEPRYGGSYAAYGPGQVCAFWDVLRQPHGRLHIAGEHAATWTGYLEGAVESGERVAAAIVG